MRNRPANSHVRKFPVADQHHQSTDQYLKKIKNIYIFISQNKKLSFKSKMVKIDEFDLFDNMSKQIKY